MRARPSPEIDSVSVCFVSFVSFVVLVCLVALASAQSTRDHLAKGHELWNQRLSKSALEAFAAAARDKATAAEAHEAIGRIYLFKGWQQEGVFPGWHDEPEYRERAIAELKASLAADPSRTTAAEALKQAEAFAASTAAVPPAPPRPDVKALDDKIEALRSDQNATPAAVQAVVLERANLQADPTPLFSGAQILIERGALPAGIELAERGHRAAERFIRENESAYKMSGKSQGALARSQATAIDLVGWAAFLSKDYATATARLEEAERLSRGQDFTNQFHLGELARAQKNPHAAREHYLDALALAGGPAPLRQRATQAAAELSAMTVGSPAFEAWLSEEIDRRRDDRRAAALKSALDRPLPALPLTTLDGKALDIKALRGKVLLLNFFSSW